MNVQYLKEKKIFLLSIFLFFLIRIFFFHKGISFNGFGFWQIANLDLLKRDLLKTLYYFHYQPPIWNMLIGTILKLTDHSEELAKNVLLLIHWSFSISILTILHKLKIKLNLSDKIFLLGSLTIVLNPSLIFFENFALYNHFSCFVFFLIFYNFYLLAESKNVKYEYLILLLSLILTLTWPIFHPIFIIIIFCLTIYVKNVFELKSLIISTIFLILSLTPSIKNKYEFNFFGNASGLGQNISGLVYWNDDLRETCSYSNLSKNKEKNTINNQNVKHPSLLYENHIQNSSQALNKSNYCLKNSIQEIKNNFSKYFFYRLRVLLASHNRFSFEYFQPPIKFNDYFNFFSSLKENDYSWIIKKITINLFFVFYYSILIFYFLKIKDDENFKKASLCIFLLHFYILTIGTFLNNQEQERFRYTSGIFLNFLFFYIILKYNFYLKILFNYKKIK
mgnify:CR=1 FL=1|tara:strand:- start:863 stop:2209 length:1347 start_codon:yes stop_codon:yes gene_type:complete